jgi:ABC-type transport system involved in cytochrome c biogenesis permease subunit
VAPFALAPGPLVETQALGLPPIANPFGLQGLAGFFGPIGALSLPLTVFTGLASVVALSVRFRRAGKEGRQQIKWVAYAVALLASVITTVTIWPPSTGPSRGSCCS